VVWAECQGSGLLPVTGAQPSTLGNKVRSPPPLVEFYFIPPFDIQYVTATPPPDRNSRFQRTSCMRIIHTISLIIAIICMPFIARPLFNASRTLIANTPIRARAAGISLPFALFSSSSTPQQQNQNQNQDGMSGQKSDSEWQAQLSPEQVS
jgi:hypothetical protein